MEQNQRRVELKMEVEDVRRRDGSGAGVIGEVRREGGIPRRERLIEEREQSITRLSRYSARISVVSLAIHRESTRIKGRTRTHRTRIA